MHPPTAAVLVLCALSLLIFTSTKGAQLKPLAPRRPNVSETFLTWMIVEIDYFMQGGKTSGTGFWAKNLQGKQIVNVTVKNVEQKEKEKILQAGPLFPGQILYQLQRCDDNSTYFNTEMKNENDHERCLVVKQCSIPDLWQWLDKAVYQGRKELVNQEVDVWEAEIAPFKTATLAVPPSYPSRPVLYQEMDVKFGVALGIQFVDFLAIDPPHEIFNVPNICSKAKTNKENKGTAGDSVFQFLYQ